MEAGPNKLRPRLCSPLLSSDGVSASHGGTSPGKAPITALGNRLGKPGFQLMLRKGTDALVGDLPIFEEQKSRNTPDFIGLCNVLIAIDIELDDLHLPVEFLR